MKNGMAMPNLNDAGREAPPTLRASLRARMSALACAGSVFLLTAGLASAAALNKDQAKRMYDRIAGVTASDATLNSMVGMDATQAALNIVTKDPAFYNNTIRNLAMPWTNRDQTVFAPLNDYVATVVGMVRDDVPFNTLWSADLVYIADAAV